jgi:N-acetyl-gamma-glutamylphosphate reductase
MNKSVKKAVLAYSGRSEPLRIFLFSPHAETVLVTANEYAGKLVGEVHKKLFSITPDDLSNLKTDVAFFAFPYRQAISLVQKLPKKQD